MVERLVIDRIGHRGDGIVESTRRADPIYVPGTLPGETVEVENIPGQPDRRHLLRIEHPSPERIVPICPHFGVCGGCALQHWSAEHYREWKRDFVVSALRQAGVDAPVAQLIDAHGEGRRRVTLHARRSRTDTIHVGFSAARTHEIVSIDHCPVLAKGLDGALPAARAIAETLGPFGKSLDIHATATDSGLDIDVRGSGSLTPALIAALARIAAKHDLARLTRHGELIAQHRAPTIRIGMAQVSLPPAAFLQATAEGEAALSRVVLAACAGCRTVADLFAGIGPFSLRLAETALVSAIDNDDAAITALKHASETAAGLKPITVERRDLFRNPLRAKELMHFDAIVFDPPRQGAQAQARELAASRVPTVVAVSCNAGTFARDMRLLVDGGYRLVTVTPVDQFRYAAHIEIVARLER